MNSWDKLGIKRKVKSYILGLTLFDILTYLDNAYIFCAYCFCVKTLYDVL